ncbi:MAG TPA: GNAT family N-acetyltransferase [Clostridia bacterium]|nr:GNAT family N-acetyltransferase [Clostridia bacterium]
MSNYGNFILETSRLKLVAVSEKYAEEMFKGLNKDVTTYMNPKQADDISETLAYVKSQMKLNEEGKDIGVVILDKVSGEFYGGGGLHSVHKPVAELGIWIKKSAHGHGYGKEAILELSKWAVTNTPILGMIYPVDFENIASRRIPEAMGGVVVSHENGVNMSGQLRHWVTYIIDAKIFRENI